MNYDKALLFLWINDILMANDSLVTMPVFGWPRQAESFGMRP